MNLTQTATTYLPFSGVTNQSPLPSVLIVDDAPDIQLISQMTLKRLRYQGQAIEISIASTGAEAIRFMAEQPRTWVVIMDIIMESDHAGLEAIEAIRTSNTTSQIIVHTGQAGLLSKAEVIERYAINGYLQKGSSNFENLASEVSLALKAYDHDRQLQRQTAAWKQAASAQQHLLTHIGTPFMHQQIVESIQAIGFSPAAIQFQTSDQEKILAKAPENWAEDFIGISDPEQAIRSVNLAGWGSVYFEAQLDPQCAPALEAYLDFCQTLARQRA